MNSLKFHDQIESGLISKPTPKDDYIEIDERKHAELGKRVIEVGLVRPKSDKGRMSAYADLKLKQWARGYQTHDKREINADTGNGGGSALGRDVKRNNKDNYIYSDMPDVEVDDSEYRRLNGIVSQMTEYNRFFVFRHYVQRKTGMLLFARSLGIPNNIYKRDLSDCKDEFNARDEVKDLGDVLSSN